MSVEQKLRRIPTLQNDFIQSQKLGINSEDWLTEQTKFSRVCKDERRIRLHMKFWVIAGKKTGNFVNAEKVVTIQHNLVQAFTNNPEKREKAWIIVNESKQLIADCLDYKSFESQIWIRLWFWEIQYGTNEERVKQRVKEWANAPNTWNYNSLNDIDVCYEIEYIEKIVGMKKMLYYTKNAN